LTIAGLVDGCWTNERSAVPAFRTANPNSGYLPHGWHPERHTVNAPMLEVPSHDVVFVGSGFPERIDWFNAIDWTGIDLGLYGTWKGLGLKKQVRQAIRGDQVNNLLASALYRKAKIGLNLYRTRNQQRLRVTGESLSPRAYELAACGAFHLSDFRPEVAEVFGDRVPTFRTPAEASVLIRSWLANDEQRWVTAGQLPACVAEASWVQRASTVLGDLQQFFAVKAA
jgi:spore maturation protein CgeB